MRDLGLVNALPEGRFQLNLRTLLRIAYGITSHLNFDPNRFQRNPPAIFGTQKGLFKKYEILRM